VSTNLSRAQAGRRVRMLGWAVAAVGALNVVSAMTPAIRSRATDLLLVFTPQVMRAANGATAIFGVCLILLGRGLALRRRPAFWASVGLLAASTVTNVLKGLDVEEAAVAAGIAFALIRNRRLFTARPERTHVAALAWWVPALAATGFAYGLLGLAIRQSLVHPDLTLGLAFHEVGARLVGFSGPLRVSSGFGDWFPPSITAVGAVSMFGLVFAALVPRGEKGAASEEERKLIRALADGPTGDTLTVFAARGDKRYVFSADRRAAVAYRYLNGIGLASGDPVGDEGAMDEAVVRYLDMCEERGWRPAVIAVREDRAPLYERHGLTPLYMGDEAVIDVPDFTLEGRRMRDVRQATNHTKRVGVTVSLRTEGELDDELRAHLLEIDRAWKGAGNEHGFLMALDGLLTGREADSLVPICYDPDGKPIAFQRYVRCRGGRALSLDAMRRYRDAPNGVNERMIVETVGWARRRGIEEVSLNFAAFRELIDPKEMPTGRAAQAWMFRRIRGFFQIESLWFFNKKFRPRWVKRYILHRGLADIPAVGIATINAESLVTMPWNRKRDPALEPAAR
jgi:lysyl-tRNA synthetase, class II